MTIADNYEPIKQETNGVATQFSFDFYALSETFIKVYLETDGVQTLVNSTDYEITFTENGGVVAFYDPPAAGSYIIITRDTPREQETPFYTSSGFPAKTVEGRLDKLTAMVQELQDNVDRSAKVPVGNDVDISLPVPDDGKALVWDGDSLVNSDQTLQDIADKADGAYSYAQEAKGYRDQASASATLAEEWAIKTDAPVEDSEYSAKYHAQASASSAAESAASATAAQEAALSITNGWDLFDHKWEDHLLNDQNWLRADTFSWHPATTQSGTYLEAYNHLVADLESSKKMFYGWISGNPLDLSNYYTLSATPSVGDAIYSVENNTSADALTTIASISGTTIVGANGISYFSNAPETRELYLLSKDTIGAFDVYYYLASDGHKIVAALNEEDVSDVYDEFGIAWYYILDTANERFKLPRTKYGVVGLRDTVGKYVPESVPNIKGDFGASRMMLNNSVVANGAFAQKSGGSYGQEPSGTGSLSYGIDFDASRSSSAYQDSAPVQQRATQMYLYFYVGQFTQTATEQTAGLNAELFNGKVDLNAANLSAQGKSLVCGLPMPSGTYDILTLGASGTTYTAPASGYFFLYAQYASGTNTYFDVYSNSNAMGFRHWYGTNATEGAGRGFVLVEKGESITILINGTLQAVDFRFIYAKGTV